MQKLQEIAERRIQSDLIVALETLDGDIEATYSRHAADGMLKSGNTFIKVMELIKSSCGHLCNQALDHYRWVIGESFIVNDALVNSLKHQVRFYVGQLEKHAAEQLKRAANMVGNENFFERYMPDIVQANKITLERFKADLFPDNVLGTCTP